MSMLEHMPKNVMKVLLVLGIIIALYQILIPRTSLNYRYHLYYPMFGKQLTSNNEVLISGESFFLRVKTINQRLTFASTDYKVAYVNQLGKVTAYKPGVAYIKVGLSDTTLVCKVRVLKLNHDNITISVGKHAHLNVLGNWLFESFQSENKSIATVSRSGKVLGVTKGTTIIKATAKGRTLCCKVTVE